MTEVFDPAGYGPPGAPPIPMVTRWDELDPAGYEHTLTALADWITWLQTTYRIPATVIPPCWYTHSGLREDLGHLWTGWLLTQHRDAGVGMTGLDWDARREQAIPRLREATAVTGCTTTRHHPDPEPPSPDREQGRWRDHLDRAAAAHLRRAITRGVIDIVTEHLDAAEHRDQLAADLLDELAADPDQSTPDEINAVADRLRQVTAQAAAAVDLLAADVARTITDAADAAARGAALAATRDSVAAAVADAVTSPEPGHSTSVPARDWITAVERQAPADHTAARAAVGRARSS